MKKLLLAAALLCAPAVHAAGVNVLMHHNDTSHTGANLTETQLTPSNVNSAQFGKLWDYEVDSEFYAQPLIVQNVTIPGLGTHNLVIVATMNNTVYAFDADNNFGANVAPLWQTNFNDPAAGIVPPRTASIFGSVRNIDPLTPVGIVSTPVIDPTTNTLYVVSRTSQNGASYGYQLHALDLTTGADRAGSPVSITASVPGTGYDSVNGVVTFNEQQQLQRDALGLANNQVVIAWGSQGDIDPYHGWIMTYDKTTLQQTGVFNTTPTGSEGGIWQSGDGPSIDANGFVYYTVGNGTFDGVVNFGQSVVKFNVANGITVQSFFAPSNYVDLNNNDLDLGVSGPLLIPGTSLLLNGSKTGDVYLLNTGSLGGEVPGNTQIPQTFTAAAAHIHGSPVYYPYSTSGPLIYTWSESDTLKAFQFNGTRLGTQPITTSGFAAPPGMPGGVMSISANGSQAGTGVVWASIPLNADAEGAVVSGVMRAFDASNLSSELYDTQQNAARDSIGLYSKYTPPTVANGKVYMATFSNKLRVYGLLSSQAPGPKGSLTGSSSTATGTVNLTSAGSTDWAHWPGYVHKVTGGAQISDLDSLYPPYATTTYTNDQRTFTWTDGTPTTTGSVTTGVYVTGWAGGYQISAPADTNPRTLTVYVSGSNSAGRLRAYLSDGSAEDFIATTATNAGNYYIAYTLTYTAGQSGQLLYVQWTQVSSSGNVAIAGATLTGGSGPTTPPPTPTGISATQGTSVTGVMLSWSPDSGATGYTIYRSTVAGTQGAVLTSTTGTSFTDASAIPGTTYYYSIAAMNSVGSSTVSVQVSGYVPVSAPGALGGVGLGTLTTANLTSVGTSDWAHWPEFTQKATGGSQISNFTLVGNGSGDTYGNATLTLNWSDGKPTVTGSATTGSFVAGIGNGFQLTVPADTNTRQLTVYVGGWSSKGKLTAHLSDGSAADFTDSSYSSPNTIYQANYTLTYHAASAGQTLTITWTMASGSSNGNVVLDGAALAGGSASVTPPATPTGLSATQGTSATAVTVKWTAVSGATGYTLYRSTVPGTQGPVLATTAATSYPDTSAVAGTTYYYSVAATNSAGASSVSAQVSGFVAASTPPPPATPTGLSATQGTSTTAVTVSWTAVSGATGYTVYRSTASGTQGSVLGTTSAASYPDTSAVAGNTYFYSVAATNTGGASSVSAQVSGYVAASGAGALSGLGLGTLTTANLTTVGTSDWAHWPEFTQKVTGGSQISNYTLVGTGAVDTYDNATLTLAWTDGNRSATGSATTGSFVAGVGNGFQLTVPADTNTRQLTVYVGGWSSNGKLTAHLSDGSAADFTDSSYSSPNHIYQANYTLTYHAASAGQTLTVTWTMASGSSNGNVVLDGAALAGGSASVTPPATPTGVGATQGTSTTAVTVSWTAVSGATGYTIYRSTASGTQGSVLGTTAATSYPDTSAVAGNTYFYSVAATNSAGASSVSAQVSGYVAASTPPPPATPTGLSATQGTSTTAVTVSWTAVSGATGYTVYRSTASGTQGSVLGTTAAASYPDTSAVVGNTYFYSVAATNTEGASSVSAQVSGFVAASAAGALSGVGLGTLTTANLTSMGTSDWAHWPEFTQKATGGSQISNYTLVGTGAADTYGNATLTLTWSDGNRSATGSATTGSFVAGVGNGFQLTVPADTNTRQLTVYVGGWSSKGKLTAHLSDGSAADFTDSSYSSPNTIYQANYTLTYHAASAGQTLTITWTMASGSSNGNVVLDGAALAGGTAATPPATPTGLSATQGTSATAVTVKWTTVSGATGYTVYRSTASGTQGSVLGTTSAASYPDTSAVAGTTYYYSVAATNTAGASSVSAQVSGFVAASAAGALSGVGLGTLTTANLTTVGTSDWAHWPEFTQKATGGSQISNYTLVGTGAVDTYGNATLTLTWSDGNRSATGSATTGSFVAGVGNGFQLTVPADTNTRQITVYVGGWSSNGKLTAHLSDGSAADFTDSSYSSPNHIYQANYTLTYHAASAGQTLTITWTMASGSSNGNVVLDGAALAGT